MLENTLLKIRHAKAIYTNFRSLQQQNIDIGQQFYVALLLAYLFRSSSLLDGGHRRRRRTHNVL